jgi:hypothetical protein
MVRRAGACSCAAHPLSLSARRDRALLRSAATALHKLATIAHVRCWKYVAPALLLVAMARPASATASGRIVLHGAPAAWGADSTRAFMLG